MKAAEKELIYDILKTASGAVLGYTSKNFADENITFADDIDIPAAAAGGQPKPNVQAAAQANTAGGQSVHADDAAQSVQTAAATKPSVQAAFTPKEAAAKLFSLPQSPAPAPALFADIPAAETIDADSIEAIAQLVAECHRCRLGETRRNVVPGEGVLNPAVLVIGEGPGADEDAQGRPFVGRAGQLLDKMLAAISLYRNKNCFIANIVKCRPPHNRDPALDECTACSVFLQAQIRVLKPKMILAMGRIALQRLMDTAIGITRMHGKILDYNGIPFMATFHPSALLRDESYKRPAWEDLKLFRARLLQLCPDYNK